MDGISCSGLGNVQFNAYQRAASASIKPALTHHNGGRRRAEAQQGGAVGVADAQHQTRLLRRQDHHSRATVKCNQLRDPRCNACNVAARTLFTSL